MVQSDVVVADDCCALGAQDIATGTVRGNHALASVVHAHYLVVGHRFRASDNVGGGNQGEEASGHAHVPGTMFVDCAAAADVETEDGNLEGDPPVVVCFFLQPFVWLPSAGPAVPVAVVLPELRLPDQFSTLRSENAKPRH
eukprot:gb/GECG01014269.1/.p1 GENE.gb/GECG01014269.1/~~gb/GECG01014269.1/.p1  ORF type:complete len:141 (+),score=21.19 gb/GECG01014269.1/:1-423(+)